jgi:ankyrin repeat protein
VELLLTHGADIKAAQRGGYSALHSAAANGNVKLVNHLIKAGADSCAKSDDGKTPLDFAKERSQADVVEILSR